MQQQFNIIVQEERFLDVEPTEPSPQFIAELRFNQQYFDLYASEAARSELIIFPILREIYKPYAQRNDFEEGWGQCKVFSENNEPYNTEHLSMLLGGLRCLFKLVVL